MDGSATFTMVVSSTIIRTPEHNTYSAHQRRRESSNMRYSQRGMASIFAAQMKSFSCRPPIACVW